MDILSSEEICNKYAAQTMLCQSQAFPTEKSHKSQILLAFLLFKKSQNFKFWLWKSQIGNPVHTFWSTAIRRDMRAALYFCSCELRWRSTECVQPPGSKRCRIFLQLSTALCQRTADNLCSLQWHIIQQRVRVEMIHRDAGEWRHGGALPPLPFH